MTKQTQIRTVFVPVPQELDRNETPWWKSCSVPQFKVKLSSMTTTEIIALNDEIKTTIAKIQAQIEDRGKADLQWWKKARGALLFIIERGRIVKHTLTDRNASRRDERWKRLEELRQLAQIDPQQALIGLFDHLMRRESD